MDNPTRAELAARNPLAVDLVEDDERATEIRKLCALAQMPGEADRMIEDGLSVKRVKSNLFAVLCVKHGSMSFREAMDELTRV